jgi:O-antigen ligase
VIIFIFRFRRRIFYFLVLPIAIIYVGYLAAFWNADGPIAEPARAVRSINDPEGRDLQSNLYRLTERFNIRANIRAHPITGLGFGRQYIFYYPMPDLSWWPFWHYIPHNGVLFLWMKMGPVGFITFLTLCGVGILRGVQLLKHANDEPSAPILVAIVSLLLMLFVYSYVDIGVNNTRVMILLGFALGVIGTWGRAHANQPVKENAE